MKIFNALDTGMVRSLKVWKGILITWFIYLSLASTVALPLKAVLKEGLGKSTIAERLVTGIDMDVLTDLGPGFRNELHYFYSGLLIIILIGFLTNAFLTGGFFDSMKGTSQRFVPAEFFGSCARNFFPFTLITLVTGIMFLFLAFLLIALPLSSLLSRSSTEWVPLLIVKISILVFILLYMIIVLVADYARAWQVMNGKASPFRALGFGFKTAFCKLRSSYPLMLILWIGNTFFLVLSYLLIGRLKPATGIGVFMLIVLSQLLFFTRLLLKCWRYGSVTALKEINEQLFRADKQQDANQ